MITIANANALHIPLPDKSVQCVVTSPPYWGLRDYGTAKWEGGSEECDHKQNVARRDAGRINTNGFHGSTADDSDKGSINYRDVCVKCGARRIDAQIGLESTPAEYVAHIVAVMRECWRVLKDDGTLWLNLGDSYFGDSPTRKSSAESFSVTWDKSQTRSRGGNRRSAVSIDGLKPKNLCGIPWRVAFALQDDGWYLRSDIIWHKPNPMPESVTDRPTKSHEYVFLLTKQARYYYDAEAIREPISESTIERWNGIPARKNASPQGLKAGSVTGESAMGANPSGRNRRSVWTIATSPYSGAKDLADYVGDDGRPYKASPDCPIHGHLARERMSYTVGYDAPLNQNQSRNAGNGNGHEQAPASLQSATTSRNSQDERGGNVQPQSLESIDDYRSEAPRRESTLPAQTVDRTNRTLKPDAPSDRTSDLKRREYSLSANGHNRQKSKTARARRTAQHDTASDETHSHKQNMLPIVENTDSDDRIDENNTSEVSVVGETVIDLSAETSYRNADIDSPFGTSHMSLYCTCEIVSTDHFATFPPALIEPMILAGTSARGECPHCGKAWVRVVDRKTAIASGERGTGGTETARAINGQADRPLHGGNLWYQNSNESITIGWHPSCSCQPHEPIPQLVLDPFAGSGTTGQVAVKHGRRAVLLDLNTKYIDLQFERTNGVQVTMPL